MRETDVPGDEICEACCLRLYGLQMFTRIDYDESAMSRVMTVRKHRYSETVSCS